ncbi:MAG: amidinotransferase [Myxococcales bacterium]|nr:amidinotransferase [Myxococcales bacterium]
MTAISNELVEMGLDETRIAVEKQEEPVIRLLEDWGFKPIPVADRNCYNHSFQSSTLDVHRTGNAELVLRLASSV